MKRILLFTITIAAALALNGAAFAGTTISDKRYWPNQARGDGDSAVKAFAFGTTLPQLQPGPSGVQSRKSCRYQYQGGPKSGSVAC